MAKAALETVTSFEALIDYLRDELEWPLPDNANIDNTTFTYTAAELGLKEDIVGGGVEFRQLRPMTTNQPWGIFFLNLPHKDLPQTLVRNILGKLTIKKRASANDPMRPAFAAHDLLFITSTGSAEERRLAFAHFQDDRLGGNAASLKVLGWEADDTPRRAELTQRTVEEKLAWPDDEKNTDAWRAQWGSAFTDRPREAVRTSKELAKTLAALARRIRDRARELIKAQNDSGSLVKLHKAFKDALIHDLTPDAFADTYAQTITYGLLSVAMSRSADKLTQSGMLLSVRTTSPFLGDMLKTFIETGGQKPGADGEGLDFDELGVGEVVDFLRDPRLNMTAVLADFDQKNSDKDPVIHLYELFIHEYDKAQKFQRGVFYTPRQVVGFIVRSVDEVLRTELGLEDGLASIDTWGDVIARINNKPLHFRGGVGVGIVPDTESLTSPTPCPSPEEEGGRKVTLPEGVKPTDAFVRILDPATGTGTFLVETVDLIHKTMEAKWRRAGNSAMQIAALWNAYVPEHLLPRLYGFELMMAPYAIAHMKLGLKLWDTGYRFASDARLRVHLTNALEPARDFSMELAFMSDAMAHEARDANAAKRTCFTVIIGNPPYAVVSSNRAPWIQGLIADYKAGLGERRIHLDDDYIKFIALIEHYAKLTPRSILGFITNNNFLDAITFRVFRKVLASTFHILRFINLNGDVKRPVAGVFDDENVFDIQQGVTITLGLRTSKNTQDIQYASISGPRFHKYEALKKKIVLMPLEPSDPNFFFVPSFEVSNDYEVWASLGDILPRRGMGIKTERDALTIHWDRAAAEITAISFVDLPVDELRSRYNLQSDSRDWTILGAKNDLVRHMPISNYSRQIAYRPFDDRWTTYTGQSRGYLGTPSPMVSNDLSLPGNVGLAACRQQATKGFQHAFCVDRMGECCVVSNRTREITSIFPLWLKPQGTETRTLPNITPAFAKRVAALTGLRYDDGVDAPAQPTLAGVIPAKPEQTAMFGLRRERGDGGAASFGPRDLFDWIYAVLHSPAYRARYADYLKSDFARIPLPKDKALFQALIPLGTRLVALHLLDVKAAPELADPKGIRLAGSGEARVTRTSSTFENDAWAGGRMYINETRWFETVPERVANFHIGGYRPARKWLKDRTAKGGKKASDGRILTDEDILHYRRMITAMDATIDLMAEIDVVIEAHGGWPNAFRGMVDEAKA